MDNTYNYNKKNVIAAIPAYNEEKFIGEVIKETKKYIDKVIVLDDGSKDNTSRIAECVGAEVIRHEINKGKGVAINTLYNAVKVLKPSVLVLLDGDGQHNPKEIPLLIGPIINEDYDMVIGSRFLDTKSSIPKYRMLGQFILTLTTNLGSGIKVSDSQSGYRAFSFKGINCLNVKENGLSVESEMQFLAKKNKLKICEVPIKVNYDGELKRNPAKHGLSVLFRVLKLTLFR